jgi:4-hydroxy-3-methylbut-2-enyl diphosphate reductase
MKIQLAESYGFCFGVKRAIKIAEENTHSATYGPLIHNSKEINRLKNDYNVALTEHLGDFRSGDTAVIRTHGIPKNELSELRQRHVNVIDATCPYVTKPQRICEEMSAEGYDIVIFGDEDHPEIKGVKSYAQNGAHVILGAEELDTLSLKDRVALVAQTTRKVEEFGKIAAALVTRCKELRVFNTICNATFENQDAVKKLAMEADVMIIIGGKNSSNTKQLHSIASTYCPDSHHIECVDDLDAAWFEGKNFCGVSAGASTPDWIIQQVVDHISLISK